MRLSIFLRVLSLSLLLFSCKDSGTSYSVGQGSGQLNGYVSLRDSMNGAEITDHNYSGVTVSVMGGPQSASSDGDGQFTLSGLPKAQFTLLFSKAGFAEGRDVDYVYNGELLQYYGSRKMYQVRRMTPNLVIRPFEGGGDTAAPYKSAIFKSRLLDSLPTGKQYSGSIIVFFGNDASVSFSDPNTFAYTTTFTDVDKESGTATIPIYRDSLLNNGFHSNTKLYVTAYYCGFYTQNQFYVDKATGKRMYTGLSPFSSEVKSFVLP